MGSLAKSSRELVIDLINSDNGTGFAYDELVLSPPTANDVLVNNRNTTISVTSADSFQFEGSEDMYYNRLDFGVMFTGLTVTLGGQGVSDITGLLPELNATYGLGLGADDFVPQALPSNPTWPLNLTLVASPSSYAFIGQLNVVVQNIAPQIGDNLANNVLRNLGSDASTLQTALDGVNNLAEAVIRMNLARYKQDEFLRGLAEDVKNDALVAIQQALDITSIDDEIRAIQAKLTALQTFADQQNAFTPEVQQQIQTNSDSVTDLDSRVVALEVDQAMKSALITTPSATQSTGQVAMAKVAGLTKLATDVPCRVRLYVNVAARDADLARTAGSPADVGSGLLYEATTTGGALSQFVAPGALLHNQESPISALIAYTIDSDVAQVANVTLSYYQMK